MQHQHSIQEPNVSSPLRLNHLPVINYVEFNFASILNVFIHCDFLHFTGARDGRKKSDHRGFQRTDAL